MSEKWIVATGMSRGIGFEVAKKFAHAGYKIIHLGRKKSGLESEFLELDLSVPFSLESMQTLHEILSHKNIHGFFYAAGVMPLLEIKEPNFLQKNEFWHSQQLAMQVNYLSCAQLTDEVIPYLLKSHSFKKENEVPFVAHLSSLAAVDPFVGLELYGATKAATLAYFLKLSKCFASNSLHCLSIHPGTVHTEMVDSIVSSENKDAVIVELFKQLLAENRLMSAGESAEKIADFLMHREDLKINSHGKMFLADSFKVLQLAKEITQ